MTFPFHRSNVLTTSFHQGASGNQSTEDLIKQPDFSDKIKQLLGSLQQTQNQNQSGPPQGGESSPFGRRAQSVGSTFALMCNLLIFVFGISSQPGSSGPQSCDEQHGKHAHADAHERRLPAQQPPWWAALHAPPTTSQPRAAF